jgi:uncharacterized membrane protein
MYASRSRSLTPSLYILLVLGSATGVVLRFVLLGNQSIWVDEMLTLLNGQFRGSLDLTALSENLQGPLVSAMMHYWAKLGMGEAFLRLPFAMAGSLSVLIMYKLSRRLFDTWTSLHVTMFVALSPVLIWYSQEIRGYAFAVLFVLAMSYLFVEWLGRPSARTLALYAACLLAGLLSNLSAGFVALAHFGYLAFVPGRSKLLGRWVVAVFVVLLLFSPWMREIVTGSNPERLVGGDTGEPLAGGASFSAMALPYTFYTFSVGYSLGPSLREIKGDRTDAVRANIHWILITGAVFLIPLVLGLRRMIQLRPDLLVFILLWVLVPVAATAVLAMRNIKVFTPRYGLVAVPAYAMIIGQGLAVISRSRYRFFTLALVGLLAISLYNYFTYPAYGKDDSRQAAKVIEENLAEGDVVVGVYAAEALQHYLYDTADVLVYGAKHVKSPEAMRVRSAALAGQGNRVWLCLSREELVDPQGVIRRWFDRNLGLVASYEFPGVKLYLYERRETSP